MKQEYIDVPKDSASIDMKKVKVVVITTVMLSFISYWRAAAVVVSDIGSSAFYALGIAEQAVGPSAPWFILFVMLFAYGIRAVYMESSSMFVRGGSYRVVRKTLGSTFAKLAVSALVFDYLLTAPISAVSAGQYLEGLINSLLHSMGYSYQVPGNWIAVGAAVLIELYFWRNNIIGIEESSEKALRIFQITSVLAVILFFWSFATILVRGAHLPSFSVHLSDDAMGWLRNLGWLKTIGLVGVIIGMGHSILAVSGEETLAQVYREIESPKLENLKKTALVMFIFSLIFTGLNSLFAAMIVPASDLIGKYNDNALSGLAMNLIGPHVVLLVLQVFVVVVGFLILAGAVNTSLIGANSVLNRVAEDGVLHEWFRKPHGRFGTSYRIINMLAIIQLFAIIVSGGNVFLLGEAYAFGVVWTFIMTTFSILVLRYKDKSPREWRVPPNVKFGKFEIPIGLIVVFIILFALGFTNLFTKPLATEGGVTFTVVLFGLFAFSERANRRIAASRDKDLEKFNIYAQNNLTAEAVGCKHSQRKLVAVRAPNRLHHLQRCLEETDPDKSDVVVMTAKVIPGQSTAVAQTIDLPEEELFSEVIKMAEKEGKTILPIVVPTNNPGYAVAHTTVQIGAEEVFLGASERYPTEYQMQQFALYWGMVEADENHHVVIRTVGPNGEMKFEI
ncbi:MAG: APC family permease [Bacteroidetes bacterium]|jgi:amino acid transporter|nr:APC family permease [Bacteroidota bacterium]